MTGLKNQIVGKARELKGQITHDESEQVAGKIQQKQGKLQSKVARVKARVVAGTEAVVDKALE